MNKHPECEANPEGCRLKEAKGYTTCQRQGVCNEMALRDFHEKILIKATLDLFESTASAAFKIPIPNTTPPLFIMAGEENALASSETAKQIPGVAKITSVTRAFDYLGNNQNSPWVMVYFPHDDWDSRDAFAKAIGYKEEVSTESERPGEVK